VTVKCLTVSSLPSRLSRVLANLRNRKLLSGRDSGEPKSTSHHGAYTRRGHDSLRRTVLYVWCFVRFGGYFRRVGAILAEVGRVFECKFYAVGGCGLVIAVVSVPSTPRLHRVLFDLRYRKPLSGRRMGGPGPFSIVGRTRKREPVPSSYWLFCMCVIS
jgi:hypothetical protein